jgi:hypothetical protein
VEQETKHPSIELIEAFNASQSDIVVISRTDTGNYYQNLQKTQAERMIKRGLRDSG